jgi:hypothetical protein
MRPGIELRTVYVVVWLRTLVKASGSNHAGCSRRGLTFAVSYYANLAC